MTRPLTGLDAPRIRLDLNTVPILNEAAVDRALRSASPRDLAAYAEPGVPRLESAIASRLGVPREAVLVGNGSDEILDLAMRTLVPAGGSIGAIEPSFGMYDHFARANRLAVRRVRARDDLPVRELAALRADAYFVPSPNNPTGAAFPRGAFEDLVARTEGPVLIDEAYAEFARQDLRGLAGLEDRVVVTRTFSKAYGLPGIRIGYALGPPAILDPMRAIRMPYNVTSWGERVALAALEDDGFPEKAVAYVEARRGPLRDALMRAGWPVWPSRANFLFLGPTTRARSLWSGLRDRGILVKFVDWPGGEEGACLRITVGADAENAALLEALSEASA